MNAKKWIGFWIPMALIPLILSGLLIYRIDPYFHYRAPDSERYFYVMDNDRPQNDGIGRNFDFDAVITGSSMTRNFLATEADERFDRSFVKLPYLSGNYEEVNDGLRRVFLHHPEIRTVIRGLDLSMILPEESGYQNPPEYLYDENPLNDLKYLMNRDILFKRGFPMAIDRDREEFTPGITSFDDYLYVVGINGYTNASVFSVDEMQKPESQIHLTDAEREQVRENIEQNVLTLVREHPETEFYFFYTPYSVMWWQWQVSDGTICRQIEAEELATEMILDCRNVKLFSFTCRTDITSDLNNYSDNIHYGPWINRLMLKWMQEGSYRLTKENYHDYFICELQYYATYDYDSMKNQIDYEDDLIAARKILPELNGRESSVFFT